MKKGKLFLIACMIAAGTCFYLPVTQAQAPEQTTSGNRGDYGRDYDREGMSPWWGLLGLLGLIGLTGRKRVEHHHERERVDYPGNRPATARP